MPSDRNLIAVVVYRDSRARKNVRKMNVEEKPSPHQAFLLRLWQEPQDHIWRASLKTTAGEREVAFANLDELFVYLLRQTERGGMEPESEQDAS
jgi:hypothetical protein